MTWQLRLGLGLDDEWPDRLPHDAACFDWFIPPIDWRAVHRMTAIERLGHVTPREQTDAGSTMARRGGMPVADAHHGAGPRTGHSNRVPPSPDLLRDGNGVDTHRDHSAPADAHDGYQCVAVSEHDVARLERALAAGLERYGASGGYVLLRVRDRFLERFARPVS